MLKNFWASTAHGGPVGIFSAYVSSMTPGSPVGPLWHIKYLLVCYDTYGLFGMEDLVVWSGLLCLIKDLLVMYESELTCWCSVTPGRPVGFYDT